MPCTVKKTVLQIVTSENDYCIGLKGNQGKLLAHAHQAAQAQRPLSESYALDSSHGRQVERRVRVFAAPPELQATWPKLAAFGLIERRGHRDGQDFESQSWVILSQAIPADQVGALVQNHRGTIENQLHWVKDVVYGEDDSGLHRAHPATLMAFLRSWAISAFRYAGHRSITQATRLFCHDLPKLLSFL